MVARNQPTHPLQSPSYPKDALRGWGASTPRRKPPPLVPTCPIMDVGLKGGPFRDSTLVYVYMYVRGGCRHRLIYELVRCFSGFFRIHKAASLVSRIHFCLFCNFPSPPLSDMVHSAETTFDYPCPSLLSFTLFLGSLRRRPYFLTVVMEHWLSAE